MSLVICRKISRDEMIMVGDGFIVDGGGNIIATNRKKVRTTDKGFLIGIVGDVDSIFEEEVIKFDRDLNSKNLKSFLDDVLKIVDDKNISTSIIIANSDKIYNAYVENDSGKQCIRIIRYDDFCAIGSGKVQALTLRSSYLHPIKILKHIIDNNLNCFVGGKISQISLSKPLTHDGVDL